MHPNLQNFRILLPPGTHREAASCEDVDCPHFLNGWMTTTATDSIQAHYIRKDSGRTFKEVKREGEGVLVDFIFAPGQRCFQQHTQLNGREPIYAHETREGRRVHKRGEDFMEHAKEEIEKHGPK